MDNQNIAKVGRITNRTSIVVFILTIVTFAALDIFIVTPWLREVMDSGVLRSVIMFVVVTFMWVATSAAYDVIGAYANLALTRSALEGDKEICAELRREGMSLDDFMNKNKQDQIHLSVGRILSFWNEAPMAAIAHLVCLAVIRFVM